MENRISDKLGKEQVILPSFQFNFLNIKGAFLVISPNGKYISVNTGEKQVDISLCKKGIDIDSVSKLMDIVERAIRKHGKDLPYFPASCSFNEGKDILARFDEYIKDPAN